MRHVVSSILALFLATALTVEAQPIEGRVVGSDGEALVGVSVITNVAGLGAITGEDGTYRLEETEGVTRVTFSSIGYHPRQFKLEGVPETVVLERRYYRGEDIVVAAARAEAGVSAVAFDNLSRAEIERDYAVTDFPLLLETTPNLYAYSYSGGGLGASEYKIRGFDSKRISTYINGVPLNDPEDHATYFVDLPDFAEEVTDIQVQRGVGNSLYGDASFGGSINIVSGALDRTRKVTITSGYGGYYEGSDFVSEMRKQSVEFSSGLVDGRWSLAGRYSKLFSGGYRESSWFDGWSYFLSLSRLDPNMTTTVNIYGGPIRYHMAWYGIDRTTQATNRRANWSDYANETDNFDQPHYELHNTYRLGDKLTLSNTLYYIRGKGYYEQFKEDKKYFDYNIPAGAVADTSTRGDLVRQKWVTKNQYGWNPRFDWDHKDGRASLGGSFYYFDSEHWGQVVWAERVTSGIDPRHRYYEYFGKKYLASLFAHESYNLSDRVALTGNLQLKYLKYEFDQTKMGAFDAGYDYTLDWLFLSPRIGLNYALDAQTNVYASLAVSSREPNDENIYDADDPEKFPQLEVLSASGDTLYDFGDPTVERERVYDIEWGMLHRTERYQFGGNLFWMGFEDENIFEGGYDSLGREITINIDRSYRSGIELSGSAKPLDRLAISANFALNYNRITEYDTTLFYSVDSIYVDPVTQVTDTVELDESVRVDYGGKTAPGFPEYLGNLVLDYNDKWFRMTYRARFVGRQYVELYSYENLLIDPYIVSSLLVSLTWQNFLDVGHLTLSARIDNLFDKEYELSGYGGNWASRKPGERVEINAWSEYFVAAERSLYGQLKLELF